MTRAQRTILLAMKDLGGTDVGVHELSRSIQKSPGSVYRKLQCLIAQGYVERSGRRYSVKPRKELVVPSLVKFTSFFVWDDAAKELVPLERKAA